MENVECKLNRFTVNSSCGVYVVLEMLVPPLRELDFWRESLLISQTQNRV